MWIAFVVVLAVCYALEFVRPVVDRPRIASWVFRVWALNLLNGIAVVAVVLLWHAVAGDHSLLHLGRRLPWFAATLTAYLAYTFVFYWWHRARHASDDLWRIVHQIHHSPRRLETVTAFYKHPLETLLNGGLAAVLLFGVLGLDLRAAAGCALVAALTDLFYHANVRTPAWTGWLIQRPEMHRLHHEVERHEGNYGDLPLWDALFGTLRLPPKDAVSCGFSAAREERLLGMLAGVDVHRDGGGRPE